MQRIILLIKDKREEKEEDRRSEIGDEREEKE